MFIPIVFSIIIIAALLCLFITYFDIIRNKKLSERKKADLILMLQRNPFVGFYVYYFQIKKEAK
jgi:hypothetical protein